MKKIRYLVIIFLQIALVSCNRVDLVISYNIINHGDDGFLPQLADTIPKDSFNVVLNCGFNDERVRFLLNKKEIFNKKVTSNPSYCMAAQFEFLKGKENQIQLVINGRTTKEFNVDSRFNCAVVEWYSKENELKFVYFNHLPLFD